MKTAHNVESDLNGKSVWECGNCYQQTPKLTRMSKKAEANKTWDELVK